MDARWASKIIPSGCEQVWRIVVVHLPPLELDEPPLDPLELEEPAPIAEVRLENTEPQSCAPAPWPDPPPEEPPDPELPPEEPFELELHSWVPKPTARAWAATPVAKNSPSATCPPEEVFVLTWNCPRTDRESWDLLFIDALIWLLLLPSLSWSGALFSTGTTARSKLLYPSVKSPVCADVPDWIEMPTMWLWANIKGIGSLLTQLVRGISNANARSLESFMDSLSELDSCKRIQQPRSFD